MQTVKFNGPDLTEAEIAAKALREANRIISQAQKSADAAKEAITKLLIEKRGINPEILHIGDIVNIEGVLLLEIGKMNKFDEKSFSLKNPETYNAFKRDIPCKKFKPLI